ncbi:MAG: glycerol kinase GlpK [Clostridiales bacterium]|jgi:glycerol kinase|nr:glycerol kinase GlpK [Clostridiales bacterium]
MKELLMALDQGTTSSRCVIFDKGSNIISSAHVEFKQIFPKDGWVEHDACEILSSSLEAANRALAEANLDAKDISALGLTNQRETAIVWDKRTGRPLYNAVVWQCRRTSGYCDQLKAEKYDAVIKGKTGLVIDAYFSATKLKWILDFVPGARELAEEGHALFGTVDSWLIWNLTGGKVHATDYTNASRTMLFNIHTLEWDQELLEKFAIPHKMLPKVYPSSRIFGVTDAFGCEIPIAGAAGDQQAALFGQCCFEPGAIKNTYGTGCFILMNTGESPAISSSSLLTTIAWGAFGKVEYAVEGSVFIAGAVVSWMRDELGLIREASETESFARSVPDTCGVYLVPAFVGLGAPHWDQHARGVISGLTRAASKSHIIRAALESIAYQSYDVIKAMEAEADIKASIIKVDGGASANDFLMQFQADILNMRVSRPTVTESSALGAAYLAGLAAGVYSGKEDIMKNMTNPLVFSPQMAQDEADRLLDGWNKAVSRCMSKI